MAKTASVLTRVEPELKEQAEAVLDELGVPMSTAIGMFLKQVVLQRGIPFEVKLTPREPVAYGSLSADEVDRELEYGMSDIQAGRLVSAASVEAEMAETMGA